MHLYYESILENGNRRDGVVVRASPTQSVDLGFISPVESYQKTLKLIFTVSLLGAQQNSVENKPASLFAVFLGGRHLTRFLRLCVVDRW